MSAVALPLSNDFKYFFCCYPILQIHQRSPEFAPTIQANPMELHQNLSNTKLGNFIDTDTAGANAGAEVKGKAEEGTGVGTTGFTAAA